MRIRSKKEMKRDSEAHYHSMEEHAPDPQAAERFHRKPYTGVKVLIRRQGEQIGDTAEYIAENTTYPMNELFWTLMWIFVLGFSDEDKCKG